ncbi:MAG: GntR family transcriptional regulator [Pirellulales bacterium]|nr:GntR family transcriptional regulator [Pirellulales bacterium]
MFFTVDPSNGVAIYLQIVRQIKFAIAERTLRPGQLLPSVRQLSQQLTVNPNTVSRALKELQSEGIVETLRGRGIIVCEGAIDLCRQQRKGLIADRIVSVLTEALHGGLSADEIREIVEQKLASLEGQVATVTTVPPG